MIYTNNRHIYLQYIYIYTCLQIMYICIIYEKKHTHLYNKNVQWMVGKDSAIRGLRRPTLLVLFDVMRTSN